MNKLNIGCGQRLAQGWINVDFHSENPQVRRVNLLGRLPFEDGSMDAVYSSHVLEHFTPETAKKLLKECHRVLKHGGILRTVVPDLENICREYVRILDQLEDSALARRQYEWIILELLDQMTRTKPSGNIPQFYAKLTATSDKEMIAYVKSRTDTNPWTFPEPQTLRSKLSKLRWNKIKTKLIYLYIRAVKTLLPRSLRLSIVDDTFVGEKHKWMYDRHNMSLLMNQCGFSDVAFVSATRSQIPNFNEDHLDTEPDGVPYKPFSLYCEARKS